MPQLMIDVVTDAGDAEAKLAGIGDAAKGMATDVDSATRKADAATGRLDGLADSADGAASASSQAAGGLGDLGGALSALPGPLGLVGRGMEAAAPAIMGVTGAADLANLAAGKGAGVFKKLTGAIKANIVVQKILNVVQRASPIGLIVTAILALAAGFVLAYKKSETFRNVVQKAIGVVKDVVGSLVDVWHRVVDAIRGVINWVGKFVDKVLGAIGWVKDLIGKTEYASNLGDTLGGVQNAAGQIGDQIRNNQKNGGQPAAAASGGVTERVEINFNGLVTDPDAAAREIEKVLARRARRTGRRVVLA